MIYLDANAHVPMNKSALDIYLNFNNVGHPSSPSPIGRKAALALESSRDKIAELIGANKAEQIIFTSSCTQACEWGMLILSRIPGLCHISNIEHPAVKQGCENALGKIYSELKSDKDGIINFDNVKNIKSISCIHMQNEIGTIQDLKKIKEINPKCVVFSDMSQSLGKEDINVTDLNVDIAVFGAHKFGGPPGVGFMYLKDTSMWQEFGSGSRYFMDIPGTPNVVGIVATAAALEESLNTLEERRANMKSFTKTFELGIKDFGFEIIGKKSKRCPNTSFIRIPGKNNGFNLMQILGKFKIYVGLGSACGSLYTGSNPLMKTLGKQSNGQNYIRASQWGEYNEKTANYVLKVLKDNYAI